MCARPRRSSERAPVIASFVAHASWCPWCHSRCFSGAIVDSVYAALCSVSRGTVACRPQNARNRSKLRCRHGGANPSGRKSDACAPDPAAAGVGCNVGEQVKRSGGVRRFGWTASCIFAPFLW